MKMKETAVVKLPEDIRRDWDEAWICAALIRRGQARIISGFRRDGSRYRYTKAK